MNNETNHLPSPVNHVFVDFENVHTIDLAVIGTKTVHFTLLLGPRQTKLDVSLVEKLLQHAATVELVRLKSSGSNALDFTLAYYLGRAVAADPTGYFHIVSKDAGYDPLVEHLRSKHIRARRHNDYTALTFTASVAPPAAVPLAIPAVAVPAAKAKVPAKPKTPPPTLADGNGREQRVLDYLRKPAAARPRTQETFVSFLIAHFGHKISEAEALDLVENISQAGHLTIDAKGKVTYHLGG